MSEKRIEIFAGPNGSGKTTLSKLIFKVGKSLPFMNADYIAKGLDYSSSKGGDIEAGRVLIQAIDQALSKNESFAFETTLSARNWIKYIQKAHKQGYLVVLYYITTTDPKICINRIQDRLRAGGHSVPDETVRRRYGRANKLSLAQYKDLVDEWYAFDNSDNGTIMIAYRNNSHDVILEKAIYDAIWRCDEKDT